MYMEDVKAFSGGIAAGVNLAQVDGDKYFGYNKPGISAGVFVQIHFTSKFGAGMDILYSQKGSTGDAVMGDPLGSTSISRCHIGLSYVEVPFVFQYQFSSLMLEAGASYSRLLRTNEWIVEGQSLYIDKDANRFDNTDINYVFGVNRKVYKQLYANVRFQYSVLSIRPLERVPVGYGYGSKGQFNNLFSIRFMYVL